MAMPFAVLMIWRKFMDHVNDCYCCLTPSMKKGFNRKKKSLIKYRNIPSEIFPLPHSDEIPIPEQCEVDLLRSDDSKSSEESSNSEPCTSIDKEFVITAYEPHLINESELNDLIRYLDLSKVKTELLTFKIKAMKFGSKWYQCLCFLWTSTVFCPVF